MPAVAPVAADSQTTALVGQPLVPRAARARLLRQMAITAAGTLASRILGMWRDMATASLLGLSNGVLDALVLAFRIPNLMRAVFGEGALTACYVPHLAQKRQEGPAAAWEAVSAVFTALAVVLSAIVVFGQLICGWLWMDTADERTRLLMGLTALLLPYVVLICLAAQVAATLQTFSRFAWPAIAPSMLNVAWLAAAWFVAPLTGDPHSQAYVLAGAILTSGLLQLAVQAPALWRLGFRFHVSRRALVETITAILPVMGPTAFALAATRINTLCDSLMAWMLAAPAGEGAPSGWAPLEQGAAGAVYCAERLCQFPVGLIGVTVATAVFPRLSRHAAREDHPALAHELIHGLRWCLFLGLPACAGLWLIAQPLAVLLFQRGSFTAHDAERTAALVRGYSLGLWACCAVPVVLRAYCALGNTRTPVRVACCCLAVNLVLNMLLIWPLGETALAISTSACAVLQCGLLLASLVRRLPCSSWTSLVSAAGAAASATAVMYGLGHWVLQRVSNTIAPNGSALQVGITVVSCLAAYALLMVPSQRAWPLTRPG